MFREFLKPSVSKLQTGDSGDPPRRATRQDLEYVVFPEHEGWASFRHYPDYGVSYSDLLEESGSSVLPGETGSGPGPWCLWCLFEAEIGAIHANELKEIKQKRS